MRLTRRFSSLVAAEEAGVARLDRARARSTVATPARSRSAEDARAQAVLDVVHVVGGRVGEVDAPGPRGTGAAARAELGRPVGVGLVLEQRLAQLARQVEAGVVGAAALELVDHAQDLGVVAEAAVRLHAARRAPARRGARRAGGRCRAPARRASHSGSFRKSALPTLRATCADLEAVREARAVVVALPVDEDLRLVHQAPEGDRVHDAVAVALAARAQLVLLLGVAPAGESALRRPRARGSRARGASLARAVEEVRGRGAGGLVMASVTARSRRSVSLDSLVFLRGRSTPLVRRRPSRRGYLELYPHRDLAARAPRWPASCSAASAPAAGRVLDLGCGFGRHLQALRERGLDALRARPLARAARLCRGRELLPGASCAATSARCPSAAARFGAVLMLFSSFGYFEDDENARALAELARVLAPGAGSRSST